METAEDSMSRASQLVEKPYKIRKMRVDDIKSELAKRNVDTENKKKEDLVQLLLQCLRDELKGASKQAAKGVEVSSQEPVGGAASAADAAAVPLPPAAAPTRTTRATRSRKAQVPTVPPTGGSPDAAGTGRVGGGAAESELGLAHPGFTPFKDTPGGAAEPGSVAAQAAGRSAATAAEIHAAAGGLGGVVVASSVKEAAAAVGLGKQGGAVAEPEPQALWAQEEVVMQAEVELVVREGPPGSPATVAVTSGQEEGPIPRGSPLGPGMPPGSVGGQVYMASGMKEARKKVVQAIREAEGPRALFRGTLTVSRPALHAPSPSPSAAAAAASEPRPLAQGPADTGAAPSDAGVAATTAALEPPEELKEPMPGPALITGVAPPAAEAETAAEPTAAPAPAAVPEAPLVPPEPAAPMPEAEAEPEGGVPDAAAALYEMEGDTDRDAYLAGTEDPLGLATMGLDGEAMESESPGQRRREDQLGGGGDFGPPPAAVAAKPQGPPLALDSPTGVKAPAPIGSMGPPPVPTSPLLARGPPPIPEPGAASTGPGAAAGAEPEKPPSAGAPSGIHPTGMSDYGPPTVVARIDPEAAHGPRHVTPPPHHDPAAELDAPGPGAAEAPVPVPAPPNLGVGSTVSILRVGSKRDGPEEEPGETVCQPPPDAKRARRGKAGAEETAKGEGNATLGSDNAVAAAATAPATERWVPGVSEGPAAAEVHGDGAGPFRLTSELAEGMLEGQEVEGAGEGEEEGENVGGGEGQQARPEGGDGAEPAVFSFAVIHGQDTFTTSPPSINDDDPMTGPENAGEGGAGAGAALEGLVSEGEPEPAAAATAGDSREPGPEPEPGLGFGFNGFGGRSEAPEDGERRGSPERLAAGQTGVQISVADVMPSEAVEAVEANVNMGASWMALGEEVVVAMGLMTTVATVAVASGEPEPEVPGSERSPVAGAGGPGPLVEEAE